MSQDETLTIRVDRATKDRLDALARRLDRSETVVAQEAIAEYVAVQEWQIARIEAAVAAMDAGEGVPHDDVMRWVESWGTAHETADPVTSKKGG